MCHASAIIARRVNGIEQVLVIKAGITKGFWSVSRAGWRTARLTALRLDCREVYEAVLDLILVPGKSGPQIDAIIEAAFMLRDGDRYNHACSLIEQKIRRRRTERGYAAAFQPGGGGGRWAGSFTASTTGYPWI